MNPEKIIH